jgi:hypothetical protein
VDNENRQTLGIFVGDHDKHKRPSTSPQNGAGKGYRNDLKYQHFEMVRIAAINLSRGYLPDQGLLPQGGIRKFFKKTWRKAEGLRIHSRYGRPVIYEYKNGRLSYKTSNPSKAKIAYMEGDIFLVRELKKSTVETIWPGLKNPGDEFGIFALLLMLVGFEEPEYIVGRKITRIRLDMNYVETQAVIKLGGQWIQIEGKNSYRAYSEMRLNVRWVNYQLEKNLLFLGNVLDVFGEAVLVVVTLGTASIGRKVGQKIIKHIGKKAAEKGFRRIFYKILQKALGTAGKCTLKFLIALAKDLESRQTLSDLQANVGQPISGRNLVKESLTVVSTEFSNCLVDELFNSAATKHVDGFIADLLGDSTTMIKKKVAAAITKELLKLPTSTFFTKMSSAISKAAADAQAGKGKFDTLLADELKGQFMSYLPGLAKDWSKAIAGALTESL